MTLSLPHHIPQHVTLSKIFAVEVILIKQNGNGYQTNYGVHCLCKFTEIPPFKQKQPARGVLRKRCSENMQQSSWRTPMSKCDFNKVA